MTQQDREPSKTELSNGVSRQYEDEINLYDYYKVIARKKGLIIGLFLISVISAAVISLFMPKIYKGETLIEITAKEIIEIIGKPDGNKLKIIFPETINFMAGFKADEVRGATNMIRITIETERPDDFRVSVAEFIKYISNIPLLRRDIEQQKEILLKRLEELTRTINEAEKLAVFYAELLKQGKLMSVGFNPIELEISVSRLKVEKLRVERGLEGLEKIFETIEPPHIFQKHL